ncbi:response regulator transcription factor [Arcobacter sp.]|uniref:response regulator transcription factor n=1 Tax=Arcobacter sp. TaxID=1872629 RepID=UPI003D0FD5BC
MKILLMEDDLILNEIIEEHLLEMGHEVISVFCGNDAEELLYSQKFDLLLLDVNVPDIKGFELLLNLRENSIKTPAIFLTSLSLADDVEKGFQSGCDDYIKKPFELKELDLRINNIKRLFNISSNNQINLPNNMILDKENLLIKKDKEEIHISKKEIEVLIYLTRNKDKIISIEELSSNVWAYEDSPNASTIRTYIKNLRKILGEELITNIRGVGYRFNSK